MFGYFRPYRANLTQAERQVFEAHYCRICYCLRAEGGQLARFFTTYDAAIYSLMMALQTNDSPPYMPCERFGKKNMRKFATDETGMFIADVIVVAAGQKIKDDVVDGDNKKVRTANAIFGKLIDKVNKKRPIQLQNLSRNMDRLNEMQCKNANLFDVLAVYGNAVVELLNTKDPLNRDIAALVKAFSEFNFFIDMVCDYDKDFLSGAYNGLKKEDCKTFGEYFEKNYREFSEIYVKLADELLRALFAVKREGRVWNALYKIIADGTDRIVPDVIEGKDVEFRYFKDLFSRMRIKRSIKRDLKRLGVKKDEEN